MDIKINSHVKGDPNQVKLEKMQKSLKGLTGTEKKEKLKKVTSDFEALFLHKMLQEMDKTVPDAGLIKKSTGLKIFQDMLYEAVAKKVSETGDFGLGKMLYEKLEKSLNTGKSDPLNSEKPVDLNKNIELIKLKNNRSAYSPKSVLENVNRFRSIIEAAAKENGLEPELIKGIIAQESGGNPEAVSKKGAAGLMQLMPDTAKEIGIKNTRNPYENITGGIKYFQKMLNAYNGDVEKSLAAYNAGPGNVDKYDGVPPFSETKTFIDNVLHYRKMFQENEET